MVDFVIKFLRKLGGDPLTPHQGLHRHAPDAFGLNPPSQLDIEYHWLSFLGNAKFPKNFEYKIDHFSINKYRKNRGSACR